MTDDRLVAQCVIDHREDGPNGPGFYYVITDMNDNMSDPIGPFSDRDAAEMNFMEAMEIAAIDMIKKTLGLED